MKELEVVNEKELRERIENLTDNQVLIVELERSGDDDE
ncbi:hypothetical protein M2150_002633 [Lachnospiraceae bacterium PM6-15]